MAGKRKKGPNFFFGPSARKSGGSKKLPQKVVFWLKKCENFRIWHPKNFISKIFHRTNAVENALCTKKYFFNGKMEPAI